VAARDEEEAEREGVAFLTGYTPVPNARILYLREGNGAATPIAVLRHDTEMIDAIRVVKGKLAAGEKSPLMRPEDVVDQKRLAKRLKRRESTISRHYRGQDPTFPKPFTVFGTRPLWFWPEVRHWFQHRVDRRKLNTKEANALRND